MPQTKQSIDPRALSCLMLYRTSGLSGALLTLLDFLREMLPVARVNCLYAALNGSSFTLMADTSGTSHVNARRAAERRLVILPEEIDQEVIIGNLEEYRHAGMRVDPRMAGLPFMMHRSLLRFPLFEAAGNICLINIWSDEQNAFVREDIDAIRELIRPLADELRPAFSALKAPVSRAASASHYERLLQCSGMAQARELIELIAPTDNPVLILGETGTGKGEAAAAIHELSDRRDRPFIHVNCGAIPETLLESELFGYERGAFTGAHALRQGCFEQADGGTIFLDEIGEMSLPAQVRLLRILDSGAINRLGGGHPVQVDARVIAATNCDLRQKTAQGMFRKDLWYRIAVFSLEIPPLRQRREDILTLVNYFLQTKSRKLKRDLPVPVPGKELTRLYGYDWPGNVRELKHVVERALILHARSKPGEPLRFQLDPPFPPDRRKNPADPGGGWPTLVEVERRYIQSVIEETRGKLTGPGSATEILGIHYSTLRTHMREMGLLTERQRKTPRRRAEN